MAKLPEKIGKYAIVKLIAKGGMGAVYQAVHPTLNRDVILKKLTLKGSSAITKRFTREARIMMDFKNDHIVDVYDHFKERDSYYIVQEYVDGIALDALIKQQRYLPNDIALFIFLDACKALCYAHNKNVIHRDIKPANILLSKAGDIKLVDFGIATSEEDSDDGLTKEGMTLGTPSYMAPEQFQNTKNVDSRADIYSMGVTLYEMVSGKRPYPGTLESVVMIQKGKYKPVRKINPKVSPFIRKLIKKMMQVKPGRRYQNLDKIITQIQKHLKKRSLPLIKERLVKVIRGEQVVQEPRVKLSFLKKLLLGFVFFVVFGGGAGLFGYLQNFHYEWFMAGEYGAFQISVKIAKQLKKTPGELYVHPQIFIDDADKIPEVPYLQLYVKECKTEETKSDYVFRSPVFYLPSGHYRWKLSAENRVFWNSYFLNPRTIQRNRADTRQARVIEFVIPAPAPHPVKLNYTVKDQLNGTDITYGTRLQYRGGTRDRWQDWTGEPAAGLLSHRAHYFKFSRAGYYDRIFDPYIQPFQDELDIEAALIPLPGKVTVSSAVPDVKLALDNAQTYRSCEEGGKIVPVQPAGETPVTLLLSPGEHLITAGPYRASEADRKSVV